MNKEEITRGLTEIGAGWAVSDEKAVFPGEVPTARPTYHVHPNMGHPQQRDILRFARLRDIAAYIRVQREIRTLRAHAGNDATSRALADAQAIVLLEDFWSELAG